MTLATRIQLCFALCLTSIVPAIAQQGQRKDPSTQEQTQFSPGVVTVIPSSIQPEETFDGPLKLEPFLNSYPQIVFSEASGHPDSKPHFDPRTRTLVDRAKEVIFRRTVFCFEFSFKPLRQIYIDVPRPDGRMQRKLVWYMVYRVRYRGGDFRPAADKVAGQDVFQRMETVRVDKRKFFPMFLLRNQIDGRQYLDRILPTAREKIKVREQISAPLYNSVEISRIDIPYSSDKSSPGVWGVATWVDVDPNLDFVSVEVFGLTNAFEKAEGAGQTEYKQKALQLNFYRPGDAVRQTEDLIRFGVPAFDDPKEQKYILEQYGLEERLDYRWLFR
ncbi:MAG: hypothetical protein CMM07_23035 [Rhodopirellula sp.]|nr:hypothetical protein [Rhodopirellula sp.]